MKQAILVGFSLSVAGCICAPGESMCEGRCVDVSTDPTNCGACGVRCETECRAGQCIPGDECTSDADCDDGLACTGRETCTGRRTLPGGETVLYCRAGEHVICNDGVMCTVDRCAEPDGACTSTPDDARCGDGTCDGTGSSGCHYACDRSPCGVVEPQCGCGPGDACYLAMDGSVSCQPPGVGGDGDPCSRASDCLPGFGCLDISLDATQPDTRCAALCHAGSDCLRHVCSEPLTGMGEPIGRCASVCSLVSPTNCPRGETCALYTASGRLWTECASHPGTGAQGDRCGALGECGIGLLCVTTSTGSRCAEWCTTSSDCAGALQCVPLMPEIVLDGVTFGACL